MAKKVYTDFEKIWNRFISDYNDKEIETRFKSFLAEEKGHVDTYNSIVKDVNDVYAEIDILRNIIVDSAKVNIGCGEAVYKLKELEVLIANDTQKLAEVDAALKKVKALIKKYDEDREKVLFNYWGMLKEIQPVGETRIGDWVQFKNTYNNMF